MIILIEESTDVSVFSTERVKPSVAPDDNVLLKELPWRQVTAAYVDDLALLFSTEMNNGCMKQGLWHSLQSSHSVTVRHSNRIGLFGFPWHSMAHLR